MTPNMTPGNKIRRMIINQIIEKEGFKWDQPLLTDEDVDAAYEKIEEEDLQWDYESEFRGGDVETDIDTEYSRHYEAKSVAVEIDGEWIGWTYWYGGGKHGNPEEIDWMEDAYLLNCQEEEKLVVIRTFTKIEEEDAENSSL
jgi:hypothetical protein